MSLSPRASQGLTKDSRMTLRLNSDGAPGLGSPAATLGPNPDAHLAPTSSPPLRSAPDPKTLLNHASEDTADPMASHMSRTSDSKAEISESQKPLAPLSEEGLGLDSSLVSGSNSGAAVSPASSSGLSPGSVDATGLSSGTHSGPNTEQAVPTLSNKIFDLGQRNSNPSGLGANPFFWNHSEEALNQGSGLSGLGSKMLLLTTSNTSPEPESTPQLGADSRSISKLDLPVALDRCRTPVSDSNKTISQVSPNISGSASKGVFGVTWNTSSQGAIDGTSGSHDKSNLNSTSPEVSCLSLLPVSSDSTSPHSSILAPKPSLSQPSCMTFLLGSNETLSSSLVFSDTSILSLRSQQDSLEDNSTKAGPPGENSGPWSQTPIVELGQLALAFSASVAKDKALQSIPEGKVRVTVSEMCWKNSKLQSSSEIVALVCCRTPETDSNKSEEGEEGRAEPEQGQLSRTSTQVSVLRVCI